MYGTVLATHNLQDLLYYAILYFIGSTLMRSAGCIINDLSDKNLDKFVERTKLRPLASGRITTKQAVLFLFMLLLMSLIILIQLNITAIVIASLSVILVILYPFMKRITYWPQAFLGVTFNIGVLIAYAAIQGSLSLKAIILYLGCIFWTLAYDTIYAFMDVKDDMKIGIKSSAIAIKDLNYRLLLSLFYFIFILCVIISTYNAEWLKAQYLGSLSLAILLLLWQIISLDVNNMQNCLKRFKSNQYVGILITIAIFSASSLPLEN
jgi:4-hydroxybenzoate polyprenyltransferase